MASNSPRKIAKAKRILQATAQENLHPKSVTFNEETVETSIGGTQQIGKIKHDLLLQFDTPFVPKSVSTKITVRNKGPSTPQKSGSCGRVPVFMTQEKENKDDKTDRQTKEDKADKEAKQDNPGKQAKDDKSDKQAKDNKSDRLVKDDKADKQSRDYRTDREAKQDNPGKQAKDDKSDKQAKDNKSDRLVKDDKADKQSRDYRTEREAKQDNPGKQAKDDKSDKQAKDNKSDRLVKDDKADKQSRDYRTDRQIKDDKLDKQVKYDKAEKHVKDKADKQSRDCKADKQTKDDKSDKQVKNDKADKYISLHIATSIKDTSFQNLSLNNTNNSCSSHVRGSPLKEKPVTVSTTRNLKSGSKNFYNKQKEMSSATDSDSKSEISQSKSNEKNDVAKTEGSNFTKSSQSTSEDRRTTMERIETVALSPFKTPDGRQARRHTLESKMFATPDCYHEVNFVTPNRLLPVIPDESVDLMEEGEDSCSIIVAVRVRPFSQRELADSNTRCAVSMYGSETTVMSDSGSVYRFTYDFSLWSHDKSSSEFCDQEYVYAKLAQPLLGKAYEGYNTCLFAYGQTGSGKSYSIMGYANEPGIIPRFCEELFTRAGDLASKKRVKVNVEISFFEIYNEKIHDLLASSKDKGAKKTVLRVREHPVLGPYVEGLSTYVVNSFDDVEGWITLGNKNRATAATGMNDKSSRSHSVFTIVLTQTKTETIEGQEHDHSVNSKINLVDLAGSERQSLANTSGERLREGANINKSLLTLGKVISLLSERSVASKKRKIFIPYRDSVLTWLLKESLGGNSKTAMIATISPSNHHSDETLSTLRYAQQARSIVNVVRINEDPKAKIIRQLRAEIERLRTEQGGSMNEEALAVSMAEIARLRSEMEELSRSWQERLRQAEARKTEELQLLERSGITFKVNNSLPSLVNLNEDPQLSEMLLYVIKEGDTKVGRKIDESQHDIKLTGALIADSHCVINSKNGEVKITPIGDAQTYINGNLISQTTILHHCDRVILGGDHYFRFSHPTKALSRSDVRGSSDIKDFDFAKQELHRVQEARLQAELEEELDKARKELTEQKDGYENKLKGLETVLTKVEETQREAQTTIDSLKKQNMMLKQEVLAGRKLQELEVASSQQESDEISVSKSRIVELLEAATKSAEERLEELRRRKLEMNKSRRLANTNNSATLTPSGSTGSPGTRKDLYKMAVLLREANKINQTLKSNLVFSREDVLSGEQDDDNVQTLIRVTNTRHRMFTLWSTSKFEEKLAEMRDLYQNGGNKSADDDEVFNDPEDVWEKECSLSSPSSGLGSWKSTPKSGGRTKTMMDHRRVSSPGSGQDVEMSVMKACKTLLSSVTDRLTALDFEESVVDKVLFSCQQIKDSTDAILTSSTKRCHIGASESSWSHPVVELVTNIRLLASHTTLWTSLCEELKSGLVRELLASSADQVKAIAYQASSLLQGCEVKLTSLMSENGHKLTSGVLSLCETYGELSLATESRVLRLDHFSQDRNSSQLSSDICQNFLTGSSSFVVRTLEGGIMSVENCERRCAGWRESQEVDSVSVEVSKRLSHVLTCLEALLSKTLQVQVELTQETSTSNDPRPPQFYAMTYKRLQGVVTNVSALADSCTLLIESAELVILGKSHDSKRLERCAELIKKSSQRLLSAASCSYPSYTSLSLPSSLLNHQLSPASSTSQDPASCSSVSSQSDISTTSSSTTVTSTDLSSNSDLTDVTLLSNSQLGQIESAVQEVSMAMSLFLEYIHKTFDDALEKESATPKGRHILPHSPEKRMVTPAMNTANLKKLNIKRTLDLASRDGKDS